MSEKPVQLTRPKGEDWNDMFANVSVKERMAKLQGGAIPMKARVEKVAPPPAAPPQRADADTYSAPPPPRAPAPMAVKLPVYTPPPQQESVTISRPSAGAGYDEIDALIGGMNFDADAPDPTGVYCGRCHKGLSKGDKVFKYGGRTYHPQCWSCSRCRCELGTMEFWFEGKETLCGKCYKTFARPHCASCSEAIMEAECTIANNQKYHTHHFKCDRCGTKLQEDYFGKDGRVYCTRDYAELYNPKCIKCNSATRDKYIMVGEGCYHPSCFTCTKCSREIGEGQFAEVEGQVRCPACRPRK